MSNIEKLRKIRLEKLRALQKAGINVYPAEVLRTNSNQEALDKFLGLSKQKKKIFLVVHNQVNLEKDKIFGGEEIRPYQQA